MRKAAEFRNATVLQALKELAETVAPTAAEIARKSGYSEISVMRALDWLIEEGKAYHYGWRKVTRYFRSYRPGEAPRGFLIPPMPKGQTKAERDAAYKIRKRDAMRAKRKAEREERERIKQAEKEAKRKPLMTYEQTRERINATAKKRYHRLGKAELDRRKLKRANDTKRDETNRKRREEAAAKRAEKKAAEDNRWLQLSQARSVDE